MKRSERGIELETRAADIWERLAKFTGMTGMRVFDLMVESVDDTY